MHIVKASKLVLCRVPATGGFVVGEPFSILVEIGRCGFRFVRYVVPAGSETDGASIPRFFWRLIGAPLTGKYLEAAVVHDAAYHGELIVHEDRRMTGGVSNRCDADLLLRQLMKAYGVAWWRRWTIWAAVRCFGHRLYLADIKPTPGA